MLTATTKKRMALAVALTAALGAVTLPGGSAKADPQQLTAFIGVGSDTTQDVMNALVGFTNGANYTPVQSDAASGYKQIVSFDALPPAGVTGSCITVKPGAPAFNRPSGSSAGRRALSRAYDGSAGYGNATCGALKDISGLVQFARSSAGPAAGDLGTVLTYIPFGRDAMSFAYYRNAGSPVTTLTRADLTTLFTTGPQVIGGVRIVPCGIQTSSGTYAFWQTVTTATAGQEVAATAECNALLGGDVAGRAQENHGDELQERGDALAIVTPVLTPSTLTQGVAASAGPPVVAAVNEIQRLTPFFGPTAGTYTVSFSGQTTAPIAAGAVAATVQAALEGLSSIGAGNVTVSGGPVTAGALTVTFVGALAATNVAQITTTVSLTGVSHANDQVVIGFSAGSFISKGNGAAPGDNALAKMGSISDNGGTPAVNLGSPVQGIAPSLSPVTTFYSDATFGRYVYNVLPTAVSNSAFGNDAIKSLFVGNTTVNTNPRSVCAQGGTILKFGFLGIGTLCGDTAIKGSYINGTL